MNFRRYYIPNALIFITQVVYYREPVFAIEQHVDLLRSTLRTVKEFHPFAMLAYVFLPDHFHVLIRPSGRSNFSQIMGSLKTNFTKKYKQQAGISGRMKFWQKRFRDHIIRDELDLQRHMNYIHYNPVRHGYVNKPEDWLHSSYLSWKDRGAYSDGWGWTLPETLNELERVERSLE